MNKRLRTLSFVLWEVPLFVCKACEKLGPNKTASPLSKKLMDILVQWSPVDHSPKEPKCLLSECKSFVRLNCPQGRRTFPVDYRVDFGTFKTNCVVVFSWGMWCFWEKRNGKEEIVGSKALCFQAWQKLCVLCEQSLYLASQWSALGLRDAILLMFLMNIFSISRKVTFVVCVVK